MIPVFHDLGGCSCHTASVGATAWAIGISRAVIVVWIVLVPFCCKQESCVPATKTRHHTSVLTERLPISRHFHISDDSAALHTVLVDIVEIFLQCRSHIVRLEDVLFRISDNRSVAVVGRNNHKTILSHVEDIKRWR